MPIDYQNFIHPNDKKAMDALNKVPGFSKITKEFMSLVDERYKNICYTSSYIKLSKKQMPEIYNLLPPICQKLGIKVPDLYVEPNRKAPNACTYGDTNPFILINAAAIECLSLNEIQALLAHECGHILCHHTLYKTMAHFILNTTGLFINNTILGNLITSGLKTALFYWDRCSEYSADRVAAYFNDGPDIFAEALIKSTSSINNLSIHIDKDEYMKQAIEYEKAISQYGINKAYEILLVLNQDHPLTAHRLLELNRWCDSNAFKSLSKKDSENIEKYSFLSANDITSWFKANNENHNYTNLIIHCGYCKKNLPHINEYLYAGNKMIFLAILNNENHIIKSRFISFVTLELSVEEVLKDNDGYLTLR